MNFTKSIYLKSIFVKTKPNIRLVKTKYTFHPNLDSKVKCILIKLRPNTFDLVFLLLFK